jgi:hypothetical protein
MSDYPTYGELAKRLEDAESALAATAALADDHAGIDVPAAIDRLRKLLDLPLSDPLFPHASMLREDLQHTVNLLVGAYGDGRVLRRGGS